MQCIQFPMRIFGKQVNVIEQKAFDKKRKIVRWFRVLKHPQRKPTCRRKENTCISNWNSDSEAHECLLILTVPKTDPRPGRIQREVP